MHLGEGWKELAGESWPDGLMPLCNKCFKIARSKEGRIMGYRTRNGKTQQYVDTELFGGDI